MTDQIQYPNSEKIADLLTDNVSAGLRKGMPQYLQAAFAWRVDDRFESGVNIKTGFFPPFCRPFLEKIVEALGHTGLRPVLHQAPEGLFLAIPTAKFEASGIPNSVATILKANFLDADMFHVAHERPDVDIALRGLRKLTDPNGVPGETWVFARGEDSNWDKVHFSFISKRPNLGQITDQLFAHNIEANIEAIGCGMRTIHIRGYENFCRVVNASQTALSAPPAPQPPAESARNLGPGPEGLHL